MRNWGAEVCPRFVRGFAALARRFSRRASGNVVLARRFARRASLRSCRGGFLGARLALRFCRGGLLGARPCVPVTAIPSARVRPCGSVVAVCSARVLAFLSRQFPRRASGLAVLLRLFASVHACLFSFVRKKETACGILRSYSAGSRSPFVRSRGALRLSAFVGSLRVWPFICGDLDGGTGDAGDEETELRGWLRGLCASLRNRIGFEMLSAGSTLGAARPQTCAKESSTLWTLFTLRRGYVGTNTHPCKKRKRPNQRTHACKTRVHGKTRPALIYGRAGRAV